MSSARRLLKKRFFNSITKILTIFILVFVLFLLIYDLNFSGKILPNIYISGVFVGGKTQEEALSILSNIKPTDKLTLIYQGQKFEINTKEILLSYNFTSSVGRAFNLPRTGNFMIDEISKLQLLYSPKKIGIDLNLDEEKLSSIISDISKKVNINPISPSVLTDRGKIKINKGKKGITINKSLLRIAIGENLSSQESTNIEIPVINEDPTLTEEEAGLLQKRAEKYLGKNILIKTESQPGVIENVNLIDSDLIKTLDPKGQFLNSEITKLISKASFVIDRDPQNPKFNFDGNKVTEFEPALDGIKIDTEILNNQINDALNKIESGDEKTIIIDAPVTRTKPLVTTDKVNDLGIRELIGHGTSTYFHSIPGRVHNVSLATSRINGILVKPGDTFSFNNALGDVSQFTGYEQAYIISGGKTILGDGGGVCQVSTTLFRALLNAGLPITERTAHAYRVGYYEQNSPPGIDATVYGPSPDLKFTNDTNNYILIVAKADPKHYSLVFDLYGTKDGRVSTVTKPIVSDVVPALPTVYQDDPTLPTGTVKQVDFSASGAKVVFNYSVEKDGKIIFSKKFTSNYRPWAAVYLRGTKI